MRYVPPQRGNLGKPGEFHRIIGLLLH